MSQDPSSWQNLSDSERYTLLDQILVIHQGFTDLLAELDSCNLSTQNGPPHHPSGLVILGATGVGKTRLIREWLTRNDHQRTETPAGSSIPYIAVSVPAKASIKGTACAFLSALGDPNPARGTQWNMITRLYTLLKSRNVRMIFVDEFQHIKDRETQQVLNPVSDFLKDIIDQSSIPMILIGRQGEAEPILLANPQLSRRVGTLRYLQPFPWDRERPQTITAFCTIMESIDQALPFDHSGLGSEDMAHRFHYASNGSLGWMMALVRQAARLAIAENCSTLNRILLKQAFDDAIARSVSGSNKKNPFEFDHFVE